VNLIAIHPEKIADSPDELRWVIPGGTLRCTGRLTSAPGALGDLIANGALGSIFVEEGAVRIALAAGRSWRLDGARVRSALHEALELPDAWEMDGNGIDARGPDEQLADIAQEVLNGTVGDFIRSHGGRPSISSAKDGVVAICLRGACKGCPAAGFTLTARIEGAIRERFPALRGVTAE